MIAGLVEEWRTMPWTPRARRLGRVLVSAAAFVCFMFAPALMLGIVNRLVP